MGIRARTALAVTLTMLVLTAILTVAAREVVQRGFERLERSDTEKSVTLALNFMNYRSEAMGATAQSYGAWTPTYNFVRTRDPRYVHSYMRDVDIASLKIDFMLFLDERGKLVYAKVIDLPTGRSRPMPAGLRAYFARYHDYLHFTDPFARVYGLIGLPEGPVVLGAAPIVTNKSEGPIRGTLVAGYFLRDSDRAALAKTTGLSAVWYSAAMPDLPADARASIAALGTEGGVQVRARDADTVVGNGVLTSLDGDPALLMQVTLARGIMAQGRTVLTYMMLGLALFIGLSVVSLIVVLNTTVLTRLAQLGNTVAEIGASEMPAARVEVRGHDEITKLAGSINDMLEALEKSRFELLELATHDALTGVYNRRRFEEELARELAEEGRLGQGGALLWFDLDRFKEVNDEYGHGAGDEVLTVFAETLRQETRGYSTLARIGGDEFVMVIPGADESEALRAAQRLHDVLAGRAVKVGVGHTIRISASVGVALYPRDGRTVEELLAHADAAMYAAKKVGNGLVRSYAGIASPGTAEVADTLGPTPTKA
jgi:diguanylate cyclase (GGDEF)-like protein